MKPFANMTVSEARKVRPAFGDPRAIHARKILDTLEEVEAKAEAADLAVTCEDCAGEGTHTCDRVGCGHEHECKTCNGEGSRASNLETWTHSDLKAVLGYIVGKR